MATTYWYSVFTYWGLLGWELHTGSTGMTPLRVIILSGSNYPYHMFEDEAKQPLSHAQLSLSYIVVHGLVAVWPHLQTVSHRGRYVIKSTVRQTNHQHLYVHEKFGITI